MTEVAIKVKEIIVRQLGVDASKLEDGKASFVTDLGADSLGVVELVMALEDEFGISIPDEEAAELTTVNKVIDYIEKHAAPHAAA